MNLFSLMNMDMLISFIVSIIVSTVKNPESRKRFRAPLYKIASVIYAAADQMGESTQLDQKIDAEIAKLKAASATVSE